MYRLIFPISILLSIAVSISNGQASSWSPCGSNGAGYRSIVVDPLQYVYIAGYPLLRSADNGASWASTGYGLSSVSMIGPIDASRDGYLYIGTYSQGIFRSTDQGNNWVMIDSGLTNLTSDGVAFDQNGIAYAATYDGVFKSTDRGNSWDQTTLTGLHTYSIAIAGNDVYAGGENSGIMRSSNTGLTWTALSTPFSDSTIDCVDCSPKGRMLVAVSQGWNTPVTNIVYVSNDSGKTWSLVTPGSSNRTYQIVFDSQGTAFAGTQNGVFKLDPGSSTWTPIDNNGLPVVSGQTVTLFFSLALSSDGLLFGSTPSGVYRRSVLTSVQNSVSDHIMDPQLFQNYPNPFNPSTTITFDLPTPGPVQLRVTSLLGQQVAILVDGLMAKGRHTVNFDGSRLASGPYFVVLRIPSASLYRTIILLR
jgi:photosystem II stability/assembly factor-like uncharacterized protein